MGSVTTEKADLGAELRDWEAGSANKVLAVQTWKPEFRSYIPMLKAWVLWHMPIVPTLAGRMGGRDLAGQPGWLNL